MSTIAPDLADAHARPAEDVVRLLETDAAHGLTSAEAAARLARAGPNSFAPAARTSRTRIALRQVTDPLTVLLLAVVAVSLAMGEDLEAVVIAAIVLLNGILGATQEASAERAVFALRDTARPLATVIRDGGEHVIDVAGIVPGDVLVLQEGDRVAADARLVASSGLAVDESALTGESLPVDKDPGPTSPTAGLADRTSLAHAGTAVTRGAARAAVVATGAATEMGKVADLTSTAKAPATPLQRRLAGVSRATVVLGVVVTVLLTAAMLVQGTPFREAFLVGASVAVAAVPEGLAATVTIALAQGARAMAARGALVRRLAAVETLGSASVIATDKTGTLTENRLRVVAVHPLEPHDERAVLRTAVLASTARLQEHDVAGDPVDAAILRAWLELGGDPRKEYAPHEIAIVPFDPARRRLTAIYAEGTGRRVATKGAPETLLARSTAPGAAHGEVREAAEALAARGLRVLAVAERHLEGGGQGDEDVDANLDLVGLVGLADPLRATSAAAVASALGAGIRVVMVTGDHPITAAAIAGQLGLSTASVLTGADLDALDPDRLAAATRGTSVFARVTPEQKLILVGALQRDGEVVAVTGDGVNDAPALRQADVGVAMGRSGTEAAREAADIILTDDDFATIVAAIREGRRIGDNVRRFVAFLLSANLGEVVLFAIAVAAGLGAPLTVIQVLVVNLLTDGLPAVALSRDPASPETMRRPPARAGVLLSRGLMGGLGLLGLTVGLAATASFLLGRAWEPAAAQTMAFATIALAELGIVFVLRSAEAAAWRAPRNVLLLAAVAASALVVVAAVHVPLLAEPIGCEPLTPAQWAAAAGLALVPAAAVEVAKAARRARAGRAAFPQR